VAAVEALLVECFLGVVVLLVEVLWAECFLAAEDRWVVGLCPSR
jgi:hypothetical protein